MASGRMRRVFTCAALVLAMLPAPAAAQQVDMTLADAVRHALGVQPAIVQARGEQRIASAGQRAAVGAFLPSVSLGGSSNNSSANRYNASTGQIVNASSNTSYSGSLSLSLDLFDGLRRFGNKSAAAATLDAADAGLINQRYQVTATTAQLFFTALADEDLVRVAETQLQRAKQSLQISVNRFAVGAAIRSDTLTSTVDLGTAQLALLQAKANMATAQANLGRQVGVDYSVHAVRDSAFAPLPDTTALRAQVLDSSPQVRQAEAQARAARAQVTVAHAQYWPTFSASYSNGYTGLEAPWSGTQNYINNWSLRFSVSWTLFDGFVREGNQVSASVQRDVAEAHATDLRLQLNALFTQQVAALFTASAQIGFADANVAAATEALRVTQDRYRLGAGTLLDLLTAEANLTQAQLNQVQARFDYLTARAQLEALAGHPL
jgi:outer membrane protein